MATFILVHGGFHGGWCWSHVTPHLLRAGHNALAPDLPGHGDDPMPQSQVTFAMAVARIAGLVERAPEPVVLVGHSMSGLVISQVAERFPDRIKMLVWNVAFLVPTGSSLQSYLETHADLGHSEVLPNALPSNDGTHVRFRIEKAREVFYNTTPIELAEQAAQRLGSTALPYLVSPVSLSKENFGRVPRTYVMCLQDRALPTSLQRKMIADSPCQHVFELNSDHSPFFSQPRQLAEYLLRVV
jgi:pimeloyl-ACP methyl ester carboxylesterase